MRPAALRPHMIDRRATLRGALTLALVALATATPARGDNLDAALIKHAPEMMTYLRDHQVRNVGVLKFRVHKAGHPASFTTGPINDNLAERIENALITANSRTNPIGIIHGADHVAASHKLPSYDKPAGQRALFNESYPLAWGNEKVTPDLMLFGVVNVRADLKSVTVLIEAFGPSSEKQDKVISIPVVTDRSLLTDLNESFQVKSRGLTKRKTRAIELDEEAVADAAEDDAKPQDAKGDVPNPAATESMLHYEIRFDGAPQSVTPNPSSPGELSVANPKENQVITFRVRSLASERIGLVLMVNGKNTLYEEEGDPSHCKAWVLDPGMDYEISGFQVDKNTRKPFRVLSEEASSQVAYGENTGLIQFHIVTQGSGNEKDDPDKGKDPLNVAPDQDDPTAQAMNISLRGLKHSKSRSLPFLDLQKEIKEHAHMPTRRKSRDLSLIGAGEVVEGGIKIDEVKNQVLVQSIAVRYYKRNGQ